VKKAEDRKAWLEGRFEKMRVYLDLKVNEEDWHGVADAAMDIREIAAELRCIEALQEKED